MRTKNLVGCACVVALLAGVTATKAAAQTSDERTYFTFSGPVEIPGVGLAPGKYMFHLADSNSSRDVVQVLSADGKRLYGMFFTRRMDRNSAATNPEVRFMEAPRGAPPAIKTWWYPGHQTGREFVYPKEQARRIAERSHEPVLTTRISTKTAKDTDTAELTRIGPKGEETPIAENNATAAEPSGTAQKGEIAPASAPTPVATVAQARTHLPQTASVSPLVALVGVWMLAAGIAIRFRRTRIG